MFCRLRTLRRKIRWLFDKWICVTLLCFVILSLPNLPKFSSRRGSQHIEDVQEYRQRRFEAYQAAEPLRSGPGEQGKGIRMFKQEIHAKESYQKEGLNLLVSDQIALDRSLPDYRIPECLSIDYPSNLPDVSVIIIYYNEAQSPILRTIHSVVNRSPPHLLKEVILVDDHSDRAELLESMQEYIRTTWPDGIVRTVRMEERSGLIRARMAGARVATGEVLVFLDAHCEATKGWLEPILSAIQASPSTVVCPIIDSIMQHTLQFIDHGKGGSVGGFFWGLTFTWISMSNNERRRRKSAAESFRSPTMAGGLFGIDREYFFHLGGYDEGMEIWGGENLEISFRIWMCGGTLEFLPCSRVGHIFRDTHPYGFPDKKRDYHGLNSMRVAEVWMDDYKRLFYMLRPDLVGKDYGDISKQVELRKRLECKSFKWYLENVYPEKQVLDENVFAYGTVRNPATNYCLDTLQKHEDTSIPLAVYPCQPVSTAQFFFLSVAYELRREETCARPAYGGVILTRCKKGNSKQMWSYDKTTGELKQEGLCLDTTGVKPSTTVVLQPCDGRKGQIWEWQHYMGNTQ